jgi:hypothetical protein
MIEDASLAFRFARNALQGEARPTEFNMEAWNDPSIVLSPSSEDSREWGVG